MRSVTPRPATFTEANSWVHLAPDQFTRHFPHVTTIWQAEDARVWVETNNHPGLDQREFAWWVLAEHRTGEPMFPVAAGFKCAFGHPYQARLGPPSADPRGCHSPGWE